MTRTAEASLLAAAAVLAAMGVTLVNLSADGGPDAQVALTFVVFIASFGGLHLAVRRWAPRASPYLFPLAAFLTAIGFTEVYRLDRELASLQRWSLLVAATVSGLVLVLLRDEGVSLLRRYRYLFLAGAVALLLLPLLPTDWPLRGAIVNGSRLWVRLQIPFGERSLSFQPGEVAKLLLAIFLASYLADRHASLTEMRQTPRTARHPGPPPARSRSSSPSAAAFAVLIYQRDLGASLLLFASSSV